MTSPSPPEAGALLEQLRSLEATARHQWHRGAHHKVVEGLASPDRQTRLLAMKLAPKDVYASVARALSDRLGADDLDDTEAHAVIDAIEGMVRRGAAFEFDVPCNPGAASKERFMAMLRQLRGLFHDPTAAASLRVRAMEVGARGQQQWAIGAARMAWNTQEPMWRRAAVRAAACQPGAESVIRSAVDDADAIVRSLAWRAAAERGVESLATAALNAALDEGLSGLERAAALDATAALVPNGALRMLQNAQATFGHEPGLQSAWDEAVAQLELED